MFNPRRYLYLLIDLSKATNLPNTLIATIIIELLSLETCSLTYFQYLYI